MTGPAELLRTAAAVKTDEPRVVVVGAGHAGGELVSALRLGGYTGPITLVGDEPSLPYHRPPLSKAYLLGTMEPADLLLRAPKVYAMHDIDVRTGRTVTTINRDTKTVTLDTGEQLRYDTLVLATGGSARRLPDPALTGAGNVFHVRTLEDVDKMRPRFIRGAHLAIVGGGYIGLEVAAVARKVGLAVTVVETLPRILSRVTGPEMSAFFHRIHSEEGVSIRTSAVIDRFSFDDRGDVSGVVLRGGDRIAADLLVVGIGLVPNTALAEHAGLPVDNGIVVDEHLRTVDRCIYAIGDVARHPCSEHDGLRRLESVPNAAEQARVVARSIMGQEGRYDAVPWFWSDQYDVKLQAVGLSLGHDRVVVRGDVARGRSVSVFYLKNGQVRAADIASNPKEFVVAKKMVAQRLAVDPGLLADVAVPLKQILQSVP
jgi:3-phenylpropionate/trans-cinnamate dioxygenase ferredoxin reductase component